MANISRKGAKQMSNRRFRISIRWLHIVIAVMLALHIYSPLRTEDAYVLLIQVVVFPLASVSGVLLWQQPRVLKFWKRLRNRQTATA